MNMNITATRILIGLFCFSQTHAAFAFEPVVAQQGPLIEPSIHNPDSPATHDNRGPIEMSRNEAYSASQEIPAAPLPAAHHGSGGVAAADGNIYDIGGVGGAGGPADALNTAYRYDPAPNTWTQVAPMPTARHSVSAVALGDYIYVIGGHVANSRRENERYNIYTHTWERMAPLNTARSGAGIAVYDGKIYVFGGNRYGTIQSSIERYDPQTNTWSYVGNMPGAAEPWRAVTLGDRIYIGTGFNTPGYEQLWAYDPVNNAWDTSLPYMNIDRTANELVAAGGRIYAIGGYGGTVNNYLSSVESWAPGDKYWRMEKQSLTTGRLQMASAVLGDNIYVFGGWNGSHLASMDIQPVGSEGFFSQPVSGNFSFGASFINDAGSPQISQPVPAFQKNQDIEQPIPPDYKIDSDESSPLAEIVYQPNDLKIGVTLFDKIAAINYVNLRYGDRAAQYLIQNINNVYGLRSFYYRGVTGEYVVISGYNDKGVLVSRYIKGKKFSLDGYVTETYWIEATVISAEGVLREERKEGIRFGPDGKRIGEYVEISYYDSEGKLRHKEINGIVTFEEGKPIAAYLLELDYAEKGIARQMLGYITILGRVLKLKYDLDENEEIIYTHIFDENGCEIAGLSIKGFLDPIELVWKFIEYKTQEKVKQAAIKDFANKIGIYTNNPKIEITRFEKAGQVYHLDLSYGDITAHYAMEDTPSSLAEESKNLSQVASR